MKAMFANLTAADFGSRSKGARATKRKWVHTLFDEIQVAIHDGDRQKVEHLLTELAVATAPVHVAATPEGSELP